MFGQRRKFLLKNTILYEHYDILRKDNIHGYKGTIFDGR